MSSRTMSLPERPGGRTSHEQRTAYRKSSRRSRPADLEPVTPFTGPDHSPSRATSSHSFATTVPVYSNTAADDVPLSPDLESAGLSDRHSMSRKRSLIRPERNRIGKNHPNYHYRQHAANMETLPSRTGTDPLYEELDGTTYLAASNREDAASDSVASKEKKRSSGDSEDTPKGRHSRKRANSRKHSGKISKRRQPKEVEQIRPPSLWDIYCAIITFWCPNFVLKCFGIKSKAQARAWREKMGLLSIIAAIMAFVGFLTFGFTRTVCGSPSQRLQINHVDSGYMIFFGQAYDLSSSHHPVAEGIPATADGEGANVLYDLSEKMGGRDGSFLFQQVNGKCKDMITLAENSDVPTNDDGDLAWYFPCNTFAQDGSTAPNLTIPYYLGYACHTAAKGRTQFYELTPSADVYFTWDDVSNSSRNLAVYSGSVLDLNLLNWFNSSQVSVPSHWSQFADTSSTTNQAIRGRDATHNFIKSGDKATAECFEQIIKVGSVDSDSVGCIASKVVLYISLVLILSVVAVRFGLAIIFQWFISRKYAAARTSQSSDKRKRNQQIEDWSEDIYRTPTRLPGDLGSSVAGASSDRTSKRASTFLPTTSRFSTVYGIDRNSRRPAMPTTMASQSSGAALLHPNSGQVGGNSSRNSYIGMDPYAPQPSPEGPGPAGFIHEAVVPQPPSDWMPFDYPLAHTLCLITAYSEGEMGIRTTIDSIAMTDYPNSHKCILVICDGIIQGKGEAMSTPDYVLGMMKDFTILPEEVEPFSYVAVASGSKRHNMAKIYSGFYDYGVKSRIPLDKQQRVPMMLVVKCGTPAEQGKSKPGNRGKRDSQIILMSFLQKVMFDERMTELEYEMFNGMWKVTGISPDFYEIVLMVDADTKVFPDSLTHMVSAMVKDPEIMGLCGETKIANKRDSWVTAIQVFEYFISHHQSKSFESVFGGVTCLPGCFCMYRIKAPKGGNNYWVPILANPDVVEHYSENVVDTLHKKNLLLLGEDRYLTTLMLRTFPKRKQVFVPQAVCKTTVPDEFMVLLSQRRRWINSTIHNLMELVLVRDLCGTFCFSMQFVVFIELMGTLVLPAAIAFTFYVGR